MSDIITSVERKQLFNILSHEASSCRACPRMAAHSAVLSRRNGTLVPRVLFVGETPGRLSADRPRQPFDSNQTETRFEQLLATIDLNRSEVFVANAVLCSPTDETDNASPSLDEIRNCSRFLDEMLTLLRAPVVVAMGAAALRSVGRLIGQPLVLAERIGTIVECDDFLLVPLYHPSLRVTNNARSFEQQKTDFGMVREAIEWTTMAAV